MRKTLVWRGDQKMTIKGVKSNLELLNEKHQEFSATENKSNEVKFWLAQYNVLINQLKSKNNKGTMDQINVAVKNLLEESKKIEE